MKRFFFIFCICLNCGLVAQNLVPNPSFEDTVQVNGQPGLNTWQTNIGTPDYFSEYYNGVFSNNKSSANIRGSQTAYDGAAIYAFSVLDRRNLNSREYMQVELLDTLAKGQEYEVEFYLSLADSFHLALADTNIGIVFKNELEPNNNDHKVREFRPFYTSDTVWNSKNKIGWEKFHYTHRATGGEKALIIGCFLNDEQITFDTVAAGGGSFPFASVGSFYYIDQVSVALKDTATALREIALQEQMQVYPNPVTDDLQLNYSGKDQLRFQLYDLQGRKTIPEYIQSGNHFSMNLSGLKTGIYLLHVNNSKGKQYTVKLIKK